ncbi:MAG: ATP-binding protein [Thermoanaerobaculia bacterium]
MLQSIHLKGVGPAPELSLELAPRLNLLTGDNGLGKSFVLDIAWWALTGTWSDRPAWPRREAGTVPTIEYHQIEEPEENNQSTYSFSVGKWVTPRRMPSPPSLVLYARVDGSFSVWDSVRNFSRPWGEANPIWAYHFSPVAIWDGLSEDGRVSCEGLIRDWVAWQRQEKESYLQLRDVLRILSPEGEELRPGEPTRVSTDDVRDHPTLELPYGKIPLIFASAGMKRVISLAYLLVWAWQEHQQAAMLQYLPPAKSIIFLVDEIESHLHPKWQRLILPALLKVAASLREDVKVQALVTTHSPLVLASAEPLFDDDQDALFTFDLKDSQVEVSKAGWRNRGDATSWLTSDVFDLGEARSIEAEQAIQQAKEAMRQPDIPVEERRRIHHELHEVLKDTDPFWGRWLVQAKAAGIEP